MSLLSLAGIESRVNELARRVGAPGDLLPTYGSTEDFARPHVEVDARGCHLVVVERGQELDRYTTDVRDELLYRIFSSVTFSMAAQHELKHRAQGRASAVCSLPRRWSCSHGCPPTGPAARPGRTR